MYLAPPTAAPGVPNLREVSGVIEKRSAKPALGEIDYLLESPDDRAGALGFGLAREPPAPLRAFNQTIDLERLQVLADAIIADEEMPGGAEAQQAQDLLLAGTSMGGARMLSALTLLRAEDTHQSRESWSYLMLAETLRRISAQPKTDAPELFARMCFNALISNTDDHPRNHAVVAMEHDWKLSPAYDLTPSTPISTERRDLALTCGALGIC